MKLYTGIEGVFSPQQKIAAKTKSEEKGKRKKKNDAAKNDQTLDVVQGESVVKPEATTAENAPKVAAKGQKQGQAPVRSRTHPHQLGSVDKFGPPTS